jgi:hypothetical protein
MNRTCPSCHSELPAEPQEEMLEVMVDYSTLVASPAAKGLINIEIRGYETTGKLRTSAGNLVFFRKKAAQ